MVFTSWAFAEFLAVVLIGLRILPTRGSRQLLILLASAFFYAYWNPWYLFLLATPSAIDFLCALRIERSSDDRARKRWLILSLATNLGLLGYFKYANFFLANIQSVMGSPIRHLDVVLPVGISFYTFKTLSYTIDVYRREIPASRSLWRYAMFVTYFPELVAGPIVRASVFLPQMVRRLEPSWERYRVGAQLVLLGVTKKLVIADRLSPFADRIFATPSAFSPATVASGVVAYSLQIYCDFSGYSDIAIGVSQIIGFDLPENFNMPYVSTSITEFWRRWHITLSSWLRDYLYIPLGGNRKGHARTYVNLMLTMLLGGLWHGASWTFVFWGFLHGSGLTLHRIWRARMGPARSDRSAVSRIAAWAMTYCFVCIAWVFFRSSTFATAIIVLRKITWLDRDGIAFLYGPLLMLVPVVVLGHVIGAWGAAMARATPGQVLAIAPPPSLTPIYQASQPFAVKPHPAAGLYVLLPLPGGVGSFVLAAWMLAVYLFASIQTSPFIYFQF